MYVHLHRGERRHACTRYAPHPLLHTKVYGASTDVGQTLVSAGLVRSALGAGARVAQTHTHMHALSITRMHLYRRISIYNTCIHMHIHVHAL